MERKSVLLVSGLLALVALVSILGATDTARAQTFNPTYSATLVNPETGANSDFTVEFSLPKGDVQFGGAVFFIPSEWGITPAEDIPIGAVVGSLTATATLGLINGACNNILPVSFTMLNASTDPTDTVQYLDSDDDDDDDEDYLKDTDQNGLQDGIEQYPDFITRVLDDQPGDEVGQPLQPIRRSAGITIVAGVNVLIQFLIFEPGTFISENIPNDAELGFPSVLLLQNGGDPDSDPIPSAITDFCTPLTSTITTFGISKDNPCTDSPPLNELDPLCEVTSAPLEITGDETSDPDEGGIPLSTNPAEGTYTFTTIAAGQRDADGDGIENGLDTCAFVANLGDPRILGDGDADSDGIDAACDPNDNNVNSDEDLDGYLNRQDNCPLVANGEEGSNQRDTDNDFIGDDCDPDPDDADAQGALIIVNVPTEITIGPGGEPSQETPPAGGDSTVDGDDDGGGGTLIIIIIAVIAAVVVIGGGAFYFMRRGA